MANYTVCDTGPLTHLSEIDLLYLLDDRVVAVSARCNVPHGVADRHLRDD